MRAIRYLAYGGPEVLQLQNDVVAPQPGAGEIQIAVRAAGVNGIDHKVRAGYLQDFMPVAFPAGTGLDASGLVTAIGDGVTDVVVGDAVFGNGRATLAETAILTSWAIKPERLSFEEAAGYPIAVETAFRILRLGRVAQGETVLISGASGGVGTATVQLAQRLGARVIAVASEANGPYLKAFGATPLAYGEDLVTRARAAADGPIHAALDVAGSGVLRELVEIVGDPDRVVTIADFTGADLGVQTTMTPEDYPGSLAKAAELAARGEFTIPVARSFQLHEADAAHESCAHGHIAGRTVVAVS